MTPKTSDPWLRKGIIARVGARELRMLAAWYRAFDAARHSDLREGCLSMAESATMQYRQNPLRLSCYPNVNSPPS
jgi:hypothetical protein